MSGNDDAPRVTRGTIVDGLRALGLARGDSVFVHSSLSRFGHVEGGARAVCRAVIDAVGPEGTVAMPAFTFGLKDVPDPMLDLAHEPSCVGLVSETFRREFATHRSRHVTHSVAAVGARAELLTSGPAPDAFCETSPFRRLVDVAGRVLLMGVDYNSCTFFHAVEYALPVPYMGMTPPGRERPGQATPPERILRGRVRVRLPGGEIVPAECSVHRPTRAYDFNRVSAMLENENLVRTVPCGESLLRLFPASPVFERVLAELRRDPYALTRRGEEPVAIPVSAPAPGAGG